MINLNILNTYSIMYYVAIPSPLELLLIRDLINLLNLEISISLISLGSLNSLNSLVPLPSPTMIDSKGKTDTKSMKNHPLKT